MNADRLELLKIDHWQTIYKNGVFKKGDLCVYFPPDTVFEGDVAQRLDILNYTSPLAKVNGVRPPGARVRAIRLRSEESFGLVVPIDKVSLFTDLPLTDFEVDTDVAEIFRVTKYEPPEPCQDGDAAKPHPAFHAYTNIENIRNFGDIFKEGEEVVITEKLHGMNSRLGKIRIINDDGDIVWEYSCGSHGVRRKEFDFKGIRSQFWNVLNDQIKSLLDELCNNQNNVILFGEIFGPGVQDMQYGLKERAFRAFDIAVNRKYLSFDEKRALFDKHGIPAVPILYKGPFSWEIVKKHTDGLTTMCEEKDAGKFSGREGVVITPVEERFDPEIGGDGRVILKSISADYLSRKGGTEFR